MKERLAELIENNFMNVGGKSGEVPIYHPVLLRYSTPNRDVFRLEDHLFGTDNPYDLWGLPDTPGHPDILRVIGFDMKLVAKNGSHANRVRVDILRDWIRFYCEEHNGETFVKLLVNLRKYYDAGITVLDHQGQPFHGEAW